MIKNVIFDLDGVIRQVKNPPLKDVLPKKLLNCASAGELDVGLDDFIDKFVHMEIFTKWDVDECSAGDVIKAMQESTDTNPDIVTAAFKKILTKKYNYLYKDTLNLIKELKKRGFRVYLLSNMNRDIVNLVSTMLDFSLFDDLVFSCDARLVKPNVGIYEFALKKWNVNANECIFIDDREKNLTPFSSLGGQTFLFDNKNLKQTLKDLRKKLFSQNTQR